MIALLLAACGGGDNTLSGSIAATHPLAFQEVTVRRLGVSTVIAYLSGQATVARLAYTPQAGSPIPAGQTIELRFSGGNAALSRATADRLMYPQAEGGTLTFDQSPDVLVPGDPLSGRFGVRFVGGQTLSGTFAAPLEVASP